MVDELLDLSSIESGRNIRIDARATDLRPVVTEAIDAFRASVSTHEIVVDLPDSPLVGHFDPTRVVQVLDNLLSNAIKYSTDNARVTVKVEEDSQSLDITVADQGIGMNPEQTARAFEKFYRVDTSNTSPTGTGLGLFICKAIVEAHGGTIQVSSTSGRGTRVAVRLPRHPPQAAS
jgi:signal transduction histidine kinase